MPEKVIISCAITGSAHVPSMSGALPVTPEQIARESIAAADAGAAIIHLHARNPDDGSPTADPSVYEQFLPLIKEATGAIVNITTGGGAHMSLDERLAAAIRFEPELCSLNMGSINFAFFPAADRIRSWKYGWEEAHVRNSEDAVFRNSFRDIRTVIESLSRAGTKFEYECYDVGHLYNLAYFMDEGLIKPPFFIQMAFGILGGIGPDPENVMFMKQTADRLFGRDAYRWSVLAAGRHQMRICAQAALLNGNVRVGMEDSLYLERGIPAANNAEQVSKLRRILSEIGSDIATPEEARAMIRLKGRDRVNF